MTRRAARRMLLAVVLALPATLLAYGAVAWAMAFWPGDAAPPTGPRIEAYVISNGVHTDLVLPVRTPRLDWRTVFDPAAFPTAPADAAFVAIGWGDREFYLNTPEWRDLTVGRALGALSGRGRTLLHVTWLRRGELGPRAWHVPVDGAGHDRLVDHVLATLPGTPPAVAVPGHYTRADAFFEARGAYDALTTCNTWTGRALREAGVPVSAWTPFAGNVVRQLAPVTPASGTATPGARRGT